MFNIEWDIETGGVKLSSKVTKSTLGISPRPVWFEELDLIGLIKFGFTYPKSDAPIMWAVNKQYWYRGQMLFEVKGANIYDSPTVVFVPGVQPTDLEPVEVKTMIERNVDQMFLLESEAIEFIRDTYITYAGVNRAHDLIKANSDVDYEALVAKLEKRTKQKMAVVKEDCDSFDIVPLETANQEGKRVLLSTKIDRFIASFSGGKDSQVVLDLVTRAIPPTAFEVIYSDTGYELPPSLDLYEEIKQYYSNRFPALRFTTTRNHESVLNYWDKIGTPSDTHRWCCTIMKTVPLYRSLKVEGNKQAKVLAFDGVRAEESTRRSGYSRIGKGKHVFTYNAHPIIKWNTVEIFLYMMIHRLPNNIAYRLGFARVGCVICPFGSDWSDYLVSRLYPNSREPFLEKLNKWVASSGIKDVSTFVKTRRWHISALGNPEIKYADRVSISSVNHSSIITAICSSELFFEWLKVLGNYSVHRNKNNFQGEINIGKSILSFEGIISKDSINIKFNTEDKAILNNILRIAYKSSFCVHCEACEVECPTGALQIVPQVKIGDKCIHCLKCLSWHEKGCIVADCLRKISGKIKMDSSLSIKGYKTFGLRDEWVEEYVSDPSQFWGSTLLGTAMFDSFKAWGKDAGLIDQKNKITPLGELLVSIYQDNPTLFWEVIWINLTYTSFIVNRFVDYIRPGFSYDKRSFADTISLTESVSSLTTLNNAIGALLDMMKNSPIGYDLMQGEENGKQRIRQAYDDLSPEALAYSLYLFADKNDIREFRVSDLYNPETPKSVALEFGITKNALLKKLRFLSSEADRVIVAELNMGLDHITLKPELTPLQVLESLTK